MKKIWNKYNDTHRLTAAFAALAIMLPMQILAIVGFKQFGEKLIFLPAARNLGYEHSRDLSISELLRLLEAVSLDTLIIIPIFFLALHIAFTNKNILPTVIFSYSIVMLFLNFINLLSVASIGRLMSYELAKDSVHWSINHPEMIDDYVSYSAALKFIIFIAMTIVLYVISVRAYRAERLGIAVRTAGALGFAVLIAAIITIPVARSAQTADLLPARSYMFSQIESMVNRAEILEPLEWTGSLSELFESYQDWEVSSNNEPPIAATGDSPMTAELAMAEPARNLIFFIIETLPGRFVQEELAKNRMPALGGLLDKSLIARNHFTVDPYSSDAIFSIYSALYPNVLQRAVSRANDNSRFSFGVFRALSMSDIWTANYQPEKPNRCCDDNMFAQLGVQKRFYSHDVVSAEDYRSFPIEALADELAIAPDFESAAVKNLINKLTLDEMAFQEMADDIRIKSQEGRRFAVSFRPEIAHGPWEKWYAGQNFWERGALLARVHDLWIRRLVSLLENLGILDETVLVITSDHGVRTTKEYPDLEVGKLDPMTFEVPLFIHSPRHFQKPVMIEKATSHIDIGSTVLALMDVPQNGVCLQGQPLWTDTQTPRYLFFHGKGYLGSDGVYDGRTFFSYNYISETLFSSSTFDFSKAEPITAPDDPEMRKFMDILLYQNKFQPTVLKLAREGQQCGRP